ncbi:MAG TPA: hypothetical protein VE684_03295 [Crenalkalicoccus sp.]|nr:hypothetical protein [Crenalkalicoccus sp.]
MKWSNFNAYDDGFLPNSGFVPHSGQAVGANTPGKAASFSSPDPSADFDLTQAYFSAGWNDNLKVVVKAYDNGVLVGHQKVVVDYGENLLVQFGATFQSVDKITIKGSGGTDHSPTDAGSGTQVSADDLTLHFPDSELITNGSFESPAAPAGGFNLWDTGSTGITGWTVVGAPGNVATVSGSFTQNGFASPRRTASSSST